MLQKYCAWIIKDARSVVKNEVCRHIKNKIKGEYLQGEYLVTGTNVVYLASTEST